MPREPKKIDPGVAQRLCAICRSPIELTQRDQLCADCRRQASERAEREKSEPENEDDRSEKKNGRWERRMRSRRSMTERELWEFMHKHEGEIVIRATRERRADVFDVTLTAVHPDDPKTAHAARFVHPKHDVAINMAACEVERSIRNKKG